MTEQKHSACPFCGGEVDPTGWLRGDGVRGPECDGCGATAPSMEVWEHRAALAQPSPVPESAAVLPPFAEKVLAKLRRFHDCAEDFESGGVDIGRHWLDLLTQLGLLNRVQRNPALWEISQQGEDLLEAQVAQAGQVPQEWQPMSNAPKDGSIIRLLVNFEDMSIDDGEGPFATIGQNNFANDGDDRWQVVGWCWEHDHFTDGKGVPIGWLPMLAAAPAQGGE